MLMIRAVHFVLLSYLCVYFYSSTSLRSCKNEQDRHGAHVGIAATKVVGSYDRHV